VGLFPIFECGAKLKALNPPKRKLFRNPLDRKLDMPSLKGGPLFGEPTFRPLKRKGRKVP